MGVRRAGLENLVGVLRRGPVRSSDATTTDGDTHAFNWVKGVMTDVGRLAGGSYSVAYRITSHGEVLGYAYTAGNVFGGVLWRRGKAIDLRVAPGRERSIAARIRVRVRRSE